MQCRVPAPDVPDVAFEVLDVDDVEADDGLLVVSELLNWEWKFAFLTVYSLTSASVTFSPW